MSSNTLAPVAPVTPYDFLQAIGACREATPLTPRQRYALEHPPSGVTIRDEDAQRDGFFASRNGRVDLHLYAAFVRKNNENRVAHIASAIEAIRDRQALSIERVERLGREIAALRSVPDELSSILDLQRDPPPHVAADRFEQTMKTVAANVARNTRARII